MEEYEIKLPEIKKKISVLTEQEQSMDQLCAKKADEIKGFETSIMNMEIKENELQENIVSDTDYESRQRIVEKMEHELHELREMCEFTRTSNMNTYALIEEASEILKNVNLVIESQKQTDYEEMMYVPHLRKYLNVGLHFSFFIFPDPAKQNFWILPIKSWPKSGKLKSLKRLMET